MTETKYAIRKEWRGLVVIGELTVTQYAAGKVKSAAGHFAADKQALEALGYRVEEVAHAGDTISA